jgi:hypothetical protein
MPQVAVLRDLCNVAVRKTQVCMHADLWHPCADTVVYLPFQSRNQWGGIFSQVLRPQFR